MKNIRIGYFLTGVLLAFNVNATITEEGSTVQKLISEGKRCTATWSSESSKSGQKTEVFGVRELNSKTQYQVYHSSERPRLWTWDFRIKNIKCNKLEEKPAESTRETNKLAKQKADRIDREKERQHQAEFDQLMKAELAEEFSSAKQLSEIARYKALIQNKISRNFNLDLDMRSKSCTLAIRLAPDGLVLSVNRSRGDGKFCAHAARAALKAKTLPIPRDPEIAIQFRDFDITIDSDL